MSIPVSGGGPAPIGRIDQICFLVANGDRAVATRALPRLRGPARELTSDERQNSQK